MSRTQRHVPAWIFVVTAGLVALRLAVARGVVEMPRHEPRLAWLELEAARDEASRTGRPLLVDFAADWCAPCARMDREVFGDEAIAARLTEGFVLARVFVAGSPTPVQASLIERWGVKGFPTVVAVLPSGTELRDGFLTRGEAHRFLDRVELRRLTEANAGRRLSARTPPASPSRSAP